MDLLPDDKLANVLGRLPLRPQQLARPHRRPTPAAPRPPPSPPPRLLLPRRPARPRDIFLFTPLHRAPHRWLTRLPPRRRCVDRGPLQWPTPALEARG
ncbi:hypothetical protein ACP70R_046988 [Stipagrostis hirtigluma subsp. patula]